MYRHRAFGPAPSLAAGELCTHVRPRTGESGTDTFTPAEDAPPRRGGSTSGEGEGVDGTDPPDPGWTPGYPAVMAGAWTLAGVVPCCCRRRAWL